MQSKLFVPVALATAALVAGCTSTGLSARETSGRDVTAYLGAVQLARPGSSVMDGIGGSGERAASRRVVLPVSVAVAQIGEVAPPDAMLDALEAEPDLFGEVQAISGNTPGYQHDRNDVVDRHLDQMLSVARDIGADYLVVYGGTIDQWRKTEPTSGLDLTILGAFLVPSRTLTAEGKSAAFILDAETGRPVATASSEARDRRVSTAVGLEGRSRDQLQDLRDETLDELTAELITRFERTAAREGASASL